MDENVGYVIALLIIALIFTLSICVGLMIFAFRQVRKSDKYRSQLEVYKEQAMFDVLTNLLNRRGFVSQAVRFFERIQRTEGIQLGVFALDLNNFKAANDTLGHATGDRILKNISDKLREILRATDLIARVGGDEFVILAPVSDSADLNRIAHKIYCRAQETVVADRGLIIHVTISVGAVLARPDEDIETTLKRADSAMYRAKDQKQIPDMNSVVTEPD